METESARLRDADLRSWLSDFVRPRYLALGVSLFLAMYVAAKFVLVIFNATDPAERWPFDLTPFGVLNLPDLQLAFLAALATGTNAVLHYSVDRRHRLWSLALTASMVASLIFALRESTANLDSTNLSRFVVLGSLLGMVVLDHVDLLRTEQAPAERFTESELRAMREATPKEVVAPRSVTRALRELQALVEEMPQEPTAPAEPSAASAVAPAPALSPEKAATADEAHMRDLLTSMIEALEDEAAVRSERGAEPQAAKRTEGERGPSREERVPSLRERAASPEALLDEARDLANRGKLEKALKRLDWVADIDERFPGLWDLAADIYDRMGEADSAAECRRRAAESRRP